MTMHPTESRPARMPMNGVDTPTLIATINAVGANPPLARFTFRAANRWIHGTHSRSAMNGFYGAGAEHQRERSTFADGDHPAVLCGKDQAPTPVEWVLHALAACLTAGIGNISAVRGVKLSRVESEVEGDIDLRGILGLSNEVRNGFTAIRVRFMVEGDAPREKLAEIVRQSVARSAVYDIVTRGLPVTVDVDAEPSA
ncbi:OsmC family protein [Prosthecomicrobium sp. N25]|uniref:OsmC family protein n=1 Tax=Prosthecomicrobium sp. N25 TaxID=3129254 RepID=UPI0030772D10